MNKKPQDEPKLLKKIVKTAELALIVFIAISIGLCVLQLFYPAIFQSQSPIATAIAVVGIPAADGCLVIKYHERLDEEQEEARRKREEARVEEDRVKESMSAAITMLGDRAPSTRIAGVYALADIADRQGIGYRQRIVGILCGYLRTKREEDGPVESTIINTIARHVSINSLTHKKIVEERQSWSGCSFDLHGATLAERVDLSDAKLSGKVNFTNVTFLNEVSFFQTEFSGISLFTGATFSGMADFTCTKFLFIVNFNKATFSSMDSFCGTKFKGMAGFTDAMFSGTAHFNGSTFNPFFQKKLGHSFGNAEIDDATNLPMDARWMDEQPDQNEWQALLRKSMLTEDY